MAFLMKKDSSISMTSFSGSPVVKAFLAGSFSGTCSTLLFQPLDLVKTRLQQADEKRGVLRITSDILARENVRGLWRGVYPSLVRTVPGVGLYFACVHTVKSQLVDGAPTPTQSLVIGAASRTLAGCIMIPVTVVKIRYESGLYRYSGIGNAMSSILRTEGVRGLTCGLGATLVRDVPFSALYLMIFKDLQARTERQNVPIGRDLQSFVCGLAAGCLASLITQPPDVIKTRAQMSSTSSLATIIGQIYKEDGMQGFFRGIVPRTARRTLMSALAWTIYEKAVKNMGLK